MVGVTIHKDNAVMKKRRIAGFPGLMAAVILLTTSGIFAQEKVDPKAAEPVKLALSQAVMCEEIRSYLPYHPAVVFSIERGKVSCFTLFDPVPEKTFIYQRWFHNDKPVTRKRLTLKPPRWATFSTMQLRQEDKGPWRVEITDENHRIFDILRFSVTD